MSNGALQPTTHDQNMIHQFDQDGLGTKHGTVQFMDKKHFVILFLYRLFIAQYWRNNHLIAVMIMSF